MPRLAAFLSLVALVGCADIGGVCTEEYRAYIVEVVGRDGGAIPDLNARTVVVETGRVLGRPGGDEDAGRPGTYYVATDSNGDEMREGQTALSFVAENDTLRASADYVFAFDGCHVSLVSGPAQIVAGRR